MSSGAPRRRDGTGASPTSARFFWRTALPSNVSSPVLQIRSPARFQLAGMISRGFRGVVPDSEAIARDRAGGTVAPRDGGLLTARPPPGRGTGYRRSRADEDAAGGRTAIKAGVGHRGRPVRAAATRGDGDDVVLARREVHRVRAQGAAVAAGVPGRVGEE